MGLAEGVADQTSAQIQVFNAAANGSWLHFSFSADSPGQGQSYSFNPSSGTSGGPNDKKTITVTRATTVGLEEGTSNESFDIVSDDTGVASLPVPVTVHVASANDFRRPAFPMRRGE